MYKFNVGDKVNLGKDRRTFHINGQSTVSGKHVYRLYGYVDWYNEANLRHVEPHCPICSQPIKLDDKKRIKEHKIVGELCYGSFMPI